MRAAFLAAILLLSTLVAFAPDPAAAEDPALVLKVGAPDEMRTRNPLPATANNVWTHDVLDRVYDRPLQERPDGTLLAYVAKGVDYDEDGTFEPASEYDTWKEHPSPSSPLNITVYYDFNGVRWHDGVQVDVWDLLFSYHLGAMHPALNASLRALFAAGAGASYEDGNRQLTVDIAAKNWDGEGAMAGDPALRVAVPFRLTEPYVRFYDRTLAPVLFPMHVWSGTGGGRHADFGCAIYVPTAIAAAKGVPCGSPDPARHGQGVPPTDPLAYRFSDAEGWILGDADVIGSGPFRFQSFVPGVEARVLRNDDYYVGGVYDARLARILKPSTIEGIRFLVCRTAQLCVFALQSGEIDYVHWMIPPEFVPDLLKVPEIAVEANADPGYFYLGYNLRRAPWGYEGDDPAKDVGFWLRQAMPHLIHKDFLVNSGLLNFGVVMHGFLSPANTYWYDDTIPKPWYDLDLARTILDSVGAGAAGIGPDPPGACTKDTPSGCRTLPGIGNASFEILRPQADYPTIPEDPLAMTFDALRQVGLNAVVKPTAFGEIANRIAAHDFDIYLLSWRIDGADPDYLFDLFHSSNAASGLNYGGFRNATFDALIEDSRRQLDRDARRSLIWQAHDVLVAARPAEPIYARTNIEGYRQDRFVNWTVVDGTIWNYWSLIGIRPPRVSGEDLHIQITAASAMYSGTSQVVTATVFGPEGRAVPGANVDLVVDVGTLTADVATARGVSLNTDINGRVKATLNAPVVEGLSMILLRAMATHPDFYSALAVSEALVYVFPPGVRFLSVAVELPIGDILGPGDALPVRLDVRDQDGEPMPDAIVNVTTTNETLLRPSRTNGTAADLTSLTVEADAAIANATSFALTVRAAAPGYYDAETSVPILVIPVARTYRCPTGEIVRDLADCPEVPTVDSTPVVLAVGTAIAVAAVAAVLLLRRHQRRRGPP